MPGTAPTAILHISDLHFGEHSRFADRTPEDVDRRLAESARNVLDARESRQAPDLVIVTGDLAEKARSPEYKAVTEFLLSLLGEFGLPRERLLVVPGNHDVSWSECQHCEICQA